MRKHAKFYVFDLIYYSHIVGAHMDTTEMLLIVIDNQGVDKNTAG